MTVTVETRTIGRRSLLVATGSGVLGIAVLGLAACTADDPAAGGTGQGQAGMTWSRVDFSYVSAYVLVRGGQAALVDTGIGNVDRLGAVLNAAGSGWDEVRDVVITHAHPDHCGNLAEVADRAANARLHAGGADIPGILRAPMSLTKTSPPIKDRVQAVEDGADVFGLRVVATPGHTPGHIAVFDADSAVLVAGDALTTTFDGILSGPLPEFTQDQQAGADSVRKLAALEPRVILVGHGPPMERATPRLWNLANSLG